MHQLKKQRTNDVWIGTLGGDEPQAKVCFDCLVRDVVDDGTAISQLLANGTDARSVRASKLMVVFQRHKEDGTIPCRDAPHTRKFCPRAVMPANVHEQKGLAVLRKTFFNQRILSHMCATAQSSQT